MLLQNNDPIFHAKNIESQEASRRHQSASKCSKEWASFFCKFDVHLLCWPEPLTPWPCFGVELLFARDNWTSRVDNNLQHRGWNNLFISCKYLSKFSFGPHTHTLSKKMQKTNKRCVKLCTTGTWWWSRVRSACSLSVVNFRKVLVTNVLTKLVQIVYRLEICLRYNSTVTIYIGRRFWYNDWPLADESFNNSPGVNPTF